MQRRDLLRGGMALGGAFALTPDLGARSLGGSATAGLVIDAHCHAGKGEAMSAPWTSFADPEVTLRRAEQAGIDRTVIFPIENPTYERANEEIARLVAEHPGKFIGFAKNDPDREASRTDRLLTPEGKKLGLKGLKLHKTPTREVLDVVEDLGIPILFHPPKVADYHMIAAAYPKVNFIMAHLGSFASQSWSEHLAAIDLARRYPNVYLETSSVVFTEYLELAARELPAEKLIFGSDGPLVDSRVELFKIRLLKLSREDERKVLSGNILRLLPA